MVVDKAYVLFFLFTTMAIAFTVGMFSVQERYLDDIWFLALMLAASVYGLVKVTFGWAHQADEVTILEERNKLLRKALDRMPHSSHPCDVYGHCLDPEHCAMGGRCDQVEN